MAQTDNHLVIMAGGVGGRFWPMSTADCPKQFIDVLGVGRTLIQLTYDRFLVLSQRTMCGLLLIRSMCLWFMNNCQRYL